MKRVSLVVLVLCLAVVNLIAQTDSTKKEHRTFKRGEKQKVKQEFRQAVREYSDSVIEPVVKVQSEKLAKLLSSKEKEQALAVKEKLGKSPQEKGGKPDFKTERQGKPDSNFAHHSKPDSNFVHRGRPDSSSRAEMKAKRQQIDSLKALLSPIVANHQTQIDSLAKTLATQQAAWTAEIAKIAQKYNVNVDSLDKRFDKNFAKRFDATDLILRGVHKERKKIDRDSFREEVRTYFNTTMRPTLKELRKELDSQLSSSDSLLLVQYREKDAELHKLFRRDSIDREQLKPQMDSLREAVKTFKEEHQILLDGLFNIIETQTAQWKTDLKAIAVKYGFPEGHADREIMPVFSKGRFLLLKPAVDTVQTQSNTLKSATTIEENSSTSVTGIATYPNPATNSFAITYTLKEDANITIKMISGNVVVKTIVNNEKQSAGKQTVIVNTSNVQSGAYYYQITTPQEVVTRKIVIVK